MPIYEFVTNDGQRVEKFLHHAEDRHRQPGLRQVLPSRIHVPNGRGRLPSMKEEIRRGYYKLEEKNGSRFPSTYSKRTIKKVWGL